MGKFVGRSGDVGGAQATIGTPQEQLQQQTPQAQGDPLLTSIIAEQAGNAPVSPPVDSAAVDQIYDEQSAIAQQQERERVPTIAERRDAAEAGQFIDPRYNPLRSDQTQQSLKDDGGLMDRAKGIATAFTSGGLKLTTDTHDTQVRPTAVALQNINAVVAGADGRTTVNPQFAAISSLVTENFIADQASSQDHLVYDDIQEQWFDTSGPKPQPIEIDNYEAQPGRKAFTQDTGNERLGKEIAREWQRYNNQQQGRPSDDYQDISREDANVLGAAVKQAWAQQNPGIIEPVKAGDGRLYFRLTNDGVVKLTEGSQARKKLFPKQHVRPSKIKPEKGKLHGEGSKLRKDVSGGKSKRLGKRVLNEAMENLSTVANVVDSRRERIGLVTILPVLGAKSELDPVSLGMLGDIHSIGPDKEADFIAAGADDPALALQDLKKSVAQQVMGVAMERGSANFLTYYLQAFNGRIAPQQTVFDPTSGKYTRFVTRSATPSTARPGSRVERNLRQMYAMMIMPKDLKADLKLPAERDRLLSVHSAQLEAWGNRLEQLLDEAITPEQADAISAAIANGVAVNNPEFPQFNGLKFDPAVDADLIRHIHSKGEDGPAVIDGLIDFAKYAKWKRDLKNPNKSVKPAFDTYFNAYMDGKTNGIASNGLQMGDINTALATGVMRDSLTDLLDDGDIRDKLQQVLVDAVDQNGWHGLESVDNTLLTYAAKEVYSIRDLNKKTTMTFGYGQDLSKFKDLIEFYMDRAALSNPKLKQSVAKLDESIGRDTLLEALHQQYVIGLTTALSEDAVRARDLMQGSALLAALMDKPLKIKSYTGYDLIFGDNVKDPDSTPVEQSFSVTKDGDRTQHKTRIHEEKVTAAAFDSNRGEGGKAEGGSIPGPIQSLDAATVAMTASGRSWDKLKKASNGNPYLHTVYDAFKVDANGYDVVLEEVNKNWLNAGLGWSYLHEMHDSIKSDLQDWNGDYRAMTDVQKDSLEASGVNTKFTMADRLYYKRPNSQGKPTQGALFNAIWKYSPDLYKLSFEAAGDKVFERMKMINKAVTSASPGGRIGPDADPGQMTPRMAKAFIDEFLRQTQIGSQLRHLANKTDKKKEELRKEISKRGPVYQYYAH